MSVFSKVLLISVLVSGLACATGRTAPAAANDLNSAIRNIEQAPDPSAAIDAFAQGTAIDQNAPALYETFVARMVDLGLPEMAFHQAETLTTLQPRNGLGWAVIAHVDARRGDMPAALSAITLAAQNAPSSLFVQRTAGELLAWYDLKADKSTLPEATQQGMANVRAALDKTPAFSSAYETAKSAYQNQASTPSTQPPPAEVAPPPQPGPYSYAEPYPPPPPDYVPDAYADYYSDWGPGWVEPYPWWWWEPVGIFGGVGFVPFASVFVFDGGHHHHHHFDHFDHGFFAHGHGGHADQFAWHHTRQGSTFFGQPARPSFRTRTSVLAEGSHSGAIAGTRVPAAPRASAAPEFRAHASAPAANAFSPRVSSGLVLAPHTPSASALPQVTPQLPRASTSLTSPTASVPRAAVGVPRTWAATPHIAPSFNSSPFAGAPAIHAAPSLGSMGSFHTGVPSGGFHGSFGAGFHSGAMGGTGAGLGGAFHGGAMGGGFHGGAMGGGFHGGGHGR